jgi:hypothetical protein
MVKRKLAAIAALLAGLALVAVPVGVAGATTTGVTFSAVSKPTVKSTGTTQAAGTLKISGAGTYPIAKLRLTLPATVTWASAPTTSVGTDHITSTRAGRLVITLPAKATTTAFAITVSAVKYDTSGASGTIDVTATWTTGAISLSPTEVANAVAAGTLSAVSVSLSDPLVGATSTYAWEFTTASSATVTKVKLTVASGSTLKTAALGAVYGIGAGTLTTTADTLTYALSSPQSVTSGDPIYIAVTKVKNTTGASPGDGVGLTSTVATYDASGIVDGGSAPYTLTATSAQIKVETPAVTKVSYTEGDHGLLLDSPVASGVAKTTVGLHVDSNASTLAIELTTSQTGGATPMPASTTAIHAGQWALYTAAGHTLGNASDTTTVADGTASKWYAPPGATALTVLKVAAPSGETVTSFTDAVIVGVSATYATPSGTATITLSYSISPTY